MRAQETFFRFAPATVPAKAGSVDPWADLVGDAVGQLELLVTLALAVHYAHGLLTGVAQASH